MKKYLIVLAGFMLAVASASAQQSAPKAAPAKALPRTADGHPDLSGIWQAGGVSLFGETGEAVPSAAGAGATPRPKREAPPYQDWALAKVKQLNADAAHAPGAQCLLPGPVVATGWPMPYEIVQNAKKTYILYEAMHAFRIIPTDGRPHPKDLDPTYMGDSTGRWEGDTFVVDAIGFNDKTWLDGNGHFHSEDLHLTERYTLNADQTITYVAIAEDPKVLTKPWTVTTLTLRHPPREERIMEYECAQNNLDVPYLVNQAQK